MFSVIDRKSDPAPFMANFWKGSGFFKAENGTCDPVGIYLLKINKKDTRTSGVVLVSFLLTTNIFHTFF